MAQRDVGTLCESLLSYLRELPSPIIPPCIYPQLQAAVALQQQQQQQATGQLENHLLSTTVGQTFLFLLALHLSALIKQLDVDVLLKNQHKKTL